MLVKIISGGQTGADLGGLLAARGAGFETGGWAPKGWRTQNGPNLDLPILGLKEHESSDYPPRTEANVRDADATIRIARSFDSPGEICTLNAIKRFGKPSLDINIETPPAPAAVEAWLRQNNVRVLNVAGNSEKTTPGIGEWTQKFLRRVLSGFVMQTSTSQIELFRRCKRAWWFKYVLRLPEEGSRPLLFGDKFHECLERWFDGKEPFPNGWDDGLFPVEAGTIKHLIADATVPKPRPEGKRTEAVVQRLPGQFIEQEFWLDLLPEETTIVYSCGLCGEFLPIEQVQAAPVVCKKGHDMVEVPFTLPRVKAMGYIDIGTIDGVHDNKTMQTTRYALDAADLVKDNQLLTYAKAWIEARREQGMFVPEKILVRHNRFVKSDGSSDFVEAWATHEQIEAEWKKNQETARDMRLLRAFYTPQEGNDVHAYQVMNTVPPVETDRKKVITSKSGPCGKYNGCSFREICGGIRSYEQHRNIIESRLTSTGNPSILPTPASTSSIRPDSTQPDSTSTPNEPIAANFNPIREEPIVMSLFGTRPAQNGGVATAPSPNPSANATPPIASTPPPSAPPVASAPPTAPPTPTLAPGRLHPQAPPFARTDCGACRVPPEGYNTGFSTVGSPCIICNQRQLAENRVAADHYTTSFDAASQTISWKVRDNFVANFQQAGLPLSGSMHAPWVRLPGAPPTAGAFNPGVLTPTGQAVPASAPTTAPTTPPAVQTPGLFGSPQGNPAPAPSTPPSPAPMLFGGVPTQPQNQAVPTGLFGGLQNASPAPQSVPTPPPAAQTPPPAPSAPAAPQAPSPQPQAQVHVPQGVTQTVNANPGTATVATPGAATTTEGSTRTRSKKGFTLLWNCTVAGPANNQVVLHEVFQKWIGLLAQDPEARAKCGATPEQKTYWDLNVWKRREVLASVAEMIAEQEKFGTKRVLVEISESVPDFTAFAHAMRWIADETIVGTGRGS